MEFVSWDDEVPNISKVIIHSMVPVTTNQIIVDLPIISHYPIKHGDFP